MRSARLAALACGLLLAACRPVATAEAPPGDPPARPLPADIVRALQTDERVLDCPHADAGAGRSGFNEDWVSARRVHLDDDGRADWLVEGRHSCLRRDGLADWWIYAEGSQGRRLLGRLRDVRGLEVLPSRSGGHAELRVLDDGGERILRYRDGGY